MRITVHNPEHVCKGVIQMTLDGQLIKGNLIPVLDGVEHHIEVWMG
jgi:cellobiose phosphorylase